MRISKLYVTASLLICFVLGQNCSRGFKAASSSDASLSFESLTGASSLGALPHLLYLFDAAAPASTTDVDAQKASIQTDGQGNVLAFRDPVSHVLAIRGFGALSLVSSGGPGNGPFLHGDSKSVNTAYDGLVLPPTAAIPLVSSVGQPWTAVFVIRQTGPNPTNLLEIHGSAHVDI